MMTSVNCSNGDHWKDWLATDCSALLLRGRESRVTTYEQMEKMAHERSNTKFIELEAGHVIHKDNFKDFSNALITFLENLN